MLIGVPARAALARGLAQAGLTALQNSRTASSRGLSPGPDTRRRLNAVSANEITEELVRQVADDVRERYALDDEDVRTLGARLADDPHVTRRAENDAFAERFTTEHRETFDRLAK